MFLHLHWKPCSKSLSLRLASGSISDENFNQLCLKMGRQLDFYCTCILLRGGRSWRCFNSHWKDIFLTHFINRIILSSSYIANLPHGKKIIIKMDAEIKEELGPAAVGFFVRCCFCGSSCTPRCMSLPKGCWWRQESRKGTRKKA